MHTQKALSMIVAVCLGFIVRGIWMTAAVRGTLGWTPNSDPSCEDAMTSVSGL